MSLARLGPWENYSYPSGYVYYNGRFIPGYIPVSNPDPDLTWEKTAGFDMGIDFSFFRSRVSGSIDYYTRKSRDVLYEYNVPVPPNIYSRTWINMGKLKSRGFEITLNVDAVRRSNFSYSFSLTRSRIMENTLVSLSGNYDGTDYQFEDQNLGEMGSPGGCGCTGFIKLEEGKPVGEIWGYIFKEIDENGNIVMEDVNQDGYQYWDYNDRARIGNGFPKSITGFGNNFTYGNWDLNLFFRAVTGHDIINSYRAIYEYPSMIYSYNLPVTVTDLRNSTTHSLAVQSSQPSSYHVENGSFISLDNLSAGYNFTLPASSPFSKIRVYLAGNNLFYITEYKGSDPNPRYTDIAPNLGTYRNPLVPGIDRTNSWARTRSFTFGANFSFQ
jgi:iron complex outermembrane receptor protein